MSTPEEIQKMMKSLAGEEETQRRGEASGRLTRSKTADKTARNTNTTHVSGSVAAVAPPVAVARSSRTAGSSSSAPGCPSTRQRALAYTSPILGFLAWLFYRIVLIFSATVQWVFNLIYSVIRYYLFLVIILFCSIYIGIYALQRWDSTIKYWPLLSIVGINAGFLTTLSHKTLCYVVFIQVPGYEICPSHPAAPLQRVDGGARAPGQHWGLDNECLASGPHIFYPPFEAAFDENISMEGVPGNVLRQIGFQQQIDWWAAQPRRYAVLDDDLRAYLAHEELVVGSNTCYVMNNEETPGDSRALLGIQKQIHALHDHILVFVDALREVQGGSMRFEGTFEATIKAPFFLLPSSSSSHEACQPAWWHWRRKRACRAQDELRRKYVDSIEAMRRILEDLYTVVHHAAGVRRDVDSEKMRALARAIAQAAQEERCVALHLQQQSLTSNWRSKIPLFGWLANLFRNHYDNTAPKQHKEQDLHTQRLTLLARVAELSGSTLTSLDFIHELLLERQEEIKQLSAYANAVDLVRVASGNPRVWEHARGLVALAEWRISAEINRVRREVRGKIREQEASEGRIKSEKKRKEGKEKGGG